VGDNYKNRFSSLFLHLTITDMTRKLRSKPLLDATELSKSFGGILAVNNTGIAVNCGSITGSIGPNGEGKTTLFNLLSNFIKPDRGQIVFNEQPIHHLPSYKIATKGFIRTFQVTRVLSRLFWELNESD
jgi:neutral amino acid transport system ATP-binding protein